MKVYYFYDEDTEELDPPKAENWDIWNLFVPIDSTREPKAGDNAIHVIYGDWDEVSELAPFGQWREWPFKLPNKFNRLVMKSLFG